MNNNQTNSLYELQQWISDLRDLGITEEEIEGCLEFYEREWQDLWTDDTINQERSN